MAAGCSRSAAPFCACSAVGSSTAVSRKLRSRAVEPSVYKNTTLMTEGCLSFTPVIPPLRKSALFSLTSLPSSVPAEMRQGCHLPTGFWFPLTSTTVRPCDTHNSENSFLPISLAVSTRKCKTLCEAESLLLWTVLVAWTEEKSCPGSLFLLLILNRNLTVTEQIPC